MEVVKNLNFQAYVCNAYVCNIRKGKGWYPNCRALSIWESFNQKFQGMNNSTWYHVEKWKGGADFDIIFNIIYDGTCDFNRLSLYFLKLLKICI